MNIKHNMNNQRKSIYSMVFGVSIGFLIQVILGALVAYWVGKGSVAESDIGLISHIIRAIGIAATVITVWVFRREQFMINAAIAVGGVCLLPIIASMLLWDARGTSIIWSIVVSAVSYLLCVWILFRFDGRGAVRKMKKYYR